MSRTIVCVVWLLLSCVTHVRAADQPITIGFSQTIRSAVLREERVISVYLPQSYATSHRYRRYPVLYIRDGDKFFHSFTVWLSNLPPMQLRMRPR